MTDPQKRVLLVDDDECIIEPVKYALESRGYKVCIARDGTEAIFRMERDAPDLVLLDMVMPRRSGFSVLQRLSDRASHAPRVIMMTGNAEPRHREHAESRGVDAFIAKPFNVVELVDRVDALLGVVTVTPDSE